MHFSRITVRPDAAGSPNFWGAFRTAYTLHKAVWELFGDRPDRERDFLYHVKDGAGSPVVYALSMRRPAETSALWETETKPFEPQLRAGTHLGFQMRANPVRTREGKRHDLVMEEKHRLRLEGVPRLAWPLEAELVQAAGERWLGGRAEKAGFRVRRVRCDGYRQHEFRRNGGPPVHLSTIDFVGVLEVVDPGHFGDQLHRGFGPAKGFGCGLMLIRRV